VGLNQLRKWILICQDIKLNWEDGAVYWFVFLFDREKLFWVNDNELIEEGMDLFYLGWRWGGAVGLRYKRQNRWAGGVDFNNRGI
jgi:hypothetical protein